MDRLTHVKCTYTGGGIYVYSALFNNEVWLYGALDTCYFDSYDIDPSEYEREHDCTFDCPADHLAIPSVPYPTFAEILVSIRKNYGDATYEEARESMQNSSDSFDLYAPCITGNDATLESVFTGKSGSRISIWRYGWNDYSASWGDMFSVRGTLKQILDELKEEM